MDDEELLNRFNQGSSFSILASELGVTRNVVAGRISRYRKKINAASIVRTEIVKLPAGRPEKKPEPVVKKYIPEQRVATPMLRADRNLKFFNKSTKEMTKNEMRQVIREAVENTK